MNNDAGPYLVIQHKDGYGDVFPLQEGERYTVGRANTNRIVVKDELCSREHAEVYFADGTWRLHDLKSLNGTRLNGEPVTKDKKLKPSDLVQLGRTELLFVQNLEELPEQARSEEQAGETVSIKKRLGQTRFLTPSPTSSPMGGNGDEESTVPVGAPMRSLSRDLSLLYRMALDMASAGSYEDLVRVVLDGLLEAVPAEVGAILSMTEDRELQVTAYRHRDPSIREYSPVSEFVTSEVLASKEAILAEDVSRDRYLRQRESIRRLAVTSLICAPVLFNGKILGLIHLYCTDPLKALGAEDLEFSMAVAKQLGNVTHQLQRQDALFAENQSLRDQLRTESELVGTSQGIKDIEEQIGRVAGTNATVLVRGESGVGKELVARALHFSSNRRQGPFVCLNCAALTETLLESELFGHEKGSFTGATEKKIGKFEAANHGTIFLDEIGEMSFGTQAKLLRVLEGHSFERVGGGVAIQVDVRVVAATNQPLEQALRDGRFRQDLFFRLQVVEITVPPLRERRDDVSLLAEHFLKRFVLETGRKIRGFTPAAMQKMQDYHWPGNVRELRNVIERAVALSRAPVLDVADIWLSSVNGSGPAPMFSPGDTFEAVSLEEVEKRHVLRVLEFTSWNKSQAATILHIERSTLDRKIKGYGLAREGRGPR
jgi:transcriptional regulator with GAF, ATPase, and Fis domain